LYEAALSIDIGPSEPINYPVWLVTAVQGYTAIAFFFRIMEKNMHAWWMKHPVRELKLLCLGFLDTDYVCLLSQHPVVKPFSCCGTDAVGID
jgi:hypothetical protein